jgi:hypothetical protein
VNECTWELAINTYWMPWRKWKNFINDFQTSLRPFLWNTSLEKEMMSRMSTSNIITWWMEFIHMDFHLWFHNLLIIH